jgi:pyroglutamyl-peptidase
MPTILVTGFGPFPGASVNPTAPLVARIARRRGARCIAHVFATSYAAVDRELPALIATHRPDAIVMFGLAARRRHVSIERFARNRISLRLPDAGGALPRRAAIATGTVAGMRGRAPFARLLAAARAARVTTALSRDAGSYLCNYIYWRALEAAAKPGGPRLVVFVHVPQVADKVRPRAGTRRRTRWRSMAFDDLVRVGDAIVSAVSGR